jgi:hypothetical protein
MIRLYKDIIIIFITGIFFRNKYQDNAGLLQDL